MVPVLVVLAFIVGCAGGAATPTPKAPAAAAPASAKSAGYANPDLLVDTEWLAQHLNDANVRVVDVRKASDYQGSHIRNSVNLEAMDPKNPLYDQGNPVKWAVLTKEQIEKVLSDLGIGNDTIVVAVDDAKGLWAARLFWTLEYYGHANGKARVLDGGLKKWQAEKRELTAELPKVQKATFTAKADPSKLATKQEVLDSIGKKDTVILATIPEDEFKGGNEKSAKRGGHIPGALRIDWTENLTGGDVPVFKSAAELSKLYETAGITRDKNVVVY